MLQFFSKPDKTTNRVSDLLLFRQRDDVKSDAISGGIPAFFPVSFARSTNRQVYFASGLNRMQKWDGVRHSALSVGVAAPTSAPTVTAEGIGTISGTYTAYVRFVDEDGNVSNLSPVSDRHVAYDAGLIRYRNVAVPTESKVSKRQILRNTAGQLAVYYVDIETDNLYSTEFTSTRTDNNLRLQQPVPLFDAEDRVIANLNGLPPSDKPILAYFNNRLWAAGEAVYSVGNVQVTNGSTTVTGVATQFTKEMEGRVLYTPQDNQTYEIESVDTINQTLTLLTNYKGSTSKFADYSIRSTPGRRTLIQWTEPGSYESWSILNSLEIASSDDLEDKITGLISNQSFLYILQSRHIYRLSFLNDPLADGGVFMAARRGCVNQRCWVNVDGMTYLMDDRGIYTFDGGDETRPISHPIQDLFWRHRTSDSDLRINWSHSQYFHASHDRSDGTIRWFVSVSGGRYPQHALCYNYNNPHWWIEEYPFPIPASDEQSTETPLPLVSGLSYTAMALGLDGGLDCVADTDGDSRANVLSATDTTLTLDSSSVLPASFLVGSPVTIVSGPGKGQSRLIVSRSSNQLVINQPWLEMPDSDSVAQIGGISWRWRSPWYMWDLSERSEHRRILLIFQPMLRASLMSLRYFRDYKLAAELHAIDWPVPYAHESDGVRFFKDDDEAEIRLDQTRGYAQVRMDGFTEVDVLIPNMISLEISGVSSAEKQRIYSLRIEGAV